jgi:hypothetical protein
MFVIPRYLALSFASVTPSRPCHVSSPRHVERSVRISSHCGRGEKRTQEAEALASTEVYDSTLLFINLDLQFG